MPQEKKHLSDNDPTRLRKHKRSGKNTYARGEEKKVLNVKKQNEKTVDIKYADENQRKVYNNVMRKGIDENSDGVNVTTWYENDKVMIVDPRLEKRRRIVRAAERFVIFGLLAALLFVLFLTVYKYLFDSQQGDDLLLKVEREAYISEDGNYLFGEFDGFVTIGDSFSRAVEVLGLPEKHDDDKYYYGCSYILIRNDKVVGYYKHKSEDFRVTVGFKELDQELLRGDSAKRVVAKIGSPDYYLGKEWIYEDSDDNFADKNYFDDEKGRLILTFDDDYKLSGYVFQER